ncbi:MAG: diguanylate cyclase [Candidatus Accumulibacter delftensis]
MFEEKERAQVTLNSIGDAVLTTDLAGNVSYLNLVAEAMTGWSSEEALGRPLSEVFTDHRRHDAPGRCESRPTRHRGEPDRRAGADCLYWSAATGSSRRSRIPPRRSTTGRPRRRRGDRLPRRQRIAGHGAEDGPSGAARLLTGLPNRVLLTERLSQAIGLAQRRGKQVALLFLDLDRFKHINDSLGHAVGDQVLQSVAGRLSACVRATDTVCRQGGDEFVILLADIEQAAGCGPCCRKVARRAAEPHLVGGHELHVTLSIGISVYPDDGSDATTVMGTRTPRCITPRQAAVTTTSSSRPT